MCAGGPQDVSCVGCEPIPIHNKFKRVKALDGQVGKPGASITDLLSAGWSGQAGTTSIIVRSRDGGQQKYLSKYNVELVDFDVEDGNGDGIFEPGEHAFVRRIRVHNSGQYHFFSLSQIRACDNPSCVC